MTAKEVIMDGNEGARFRDVIDNLDEDIILECMKSYAKEKCKELLEIVAEKAKMIDEDGDVYEQPMGFYCQGELYEIWVDKNSILNAVNLDEFIN